MISEDKLLDAWSKEEFTPEEAEAILERCLECGDGFLATVVGKTVLFSIMEHWKEEARLEAFSENSILREYIHLGGRYLENCAPDLKPRPGRMEAARKYIKEKVDERRSRKDN